MSILTTPAYIAGLDLGERRDFTALTVLHQRAVPTGTTSRVQGRFNPDRGQFGYDMEPEYLFHYDAVHLDRWRGKGYSVIPETLRATFQALRQRAYQEQHAAHVYQAVEPNITLLVDGTGVGVAVVEEIRKAGIDCIGITIHGGDVVNHEDDNYRVPKRELVARTQVLLEQKRLRIAEALPLASVLTSEMENFKAKKATLTGHDSYGAGADWREGNHDDLVLATAMACWYGEHTAQDRWEWEQSTQALAEYLRNQGVPGYR